MNPSKRPEVGLSLYFVVTIHNILHSKLSRMVVTTPTFDGSQQDTVVLYI